MTTNFTRRFQASKVATYLLPGEFGCGIVVYFNADQEPVPWAAAVV